MQMGTHPVAKKKPRKDNPQEKDASHIAFATQTQWRENWRYVNKKNPSNKQLCKIHVIEWENAVGGKKYSLPPKNAESISRFAAVINHLHCR